MTRAARLVPQGERVAPTVAPLRCPACNAPVPLGDGDVVPCAACGASVPVPEELRELRRAEREGRTDRAEAERLYKKLGKPPSWLLRTWVSVFVLGASAIGAVIYALVAIGGTFLLFAVVGLELLLHALAGPLGIDLIDRYGGGHVYAGLGAAMLVFGALPMWLAQHLQETGELRLKLQASLAAKPPERPGFPSTCRECGAALEVPANAYGVRCPYCQSDNLVRLPPEWLEAGKREAHFHTSIVDAVQQARALRNEGLQTLGVIVGVGAAAVAALGLIGHIAQFIDEDEDVFHDKYEASIGPPRVLERWDGGSIAENERAEAAPDTWIALRHREVIELATDEHCPTIKVFNTTTFPFIQREDVLTVGIAADGTRVARYRAPYTGIFQVELRPNSSSLRWHFAAKDLPELGPLTGCD